MWLRQSIIRSMEPQTNKSLQWDQHNVRCLESTQAKWCRNWAGRGTWLNYERGLVSASSLGFSSAHAAVVGEPVGGGELAGEFQEAFGERIWVTITKHKSSGGTNRVEVSRWPSQNESVCLNENHCGSSAVRPSPQIRLCIRSCKDLLSSSGKMKQLQPLIPPREQGGKKLYNHVIKFSKTLCMYFFLTCYILYILKL